MRIRPYLLSMSRSRERASAEYDKEDGEERTRRGEVGSGHKFTKCRVLYVLWHVIMMIMEEYMICVKRKILLNLLCIEEMDLQFYLGSLFTPGKLFQHAKDEGQDSSNR